MNNYHQFELALTVGKVKAMRNETRSSTRVLCLHGWLDNRASFLPILPYLQDVECVAVDLIGHGQSSHREAGAFYHYIDYVRDIKLILEKLQWPHCHLLGHSMGGSLSLMTANAFPDSIQSLCMIDSLHPMLRDPQEGPAMLRRAMDQITHWDPHRERIYPSMEAAIRARLSASPYPQTSENAALIMQYATEKTEQGYRLLSDARLNFRSPMMLSSPQIPPFISSLELPILAILGRKGFTEARKTSKQTLNLFKSIQVEYLPGGHHVHMEAPHKTADLYLAFLAAQN